jgi:hypothetical protein
LHAVINASQCGTIECNFVINPVRTFFSLYARGKHNLEDSLSSATSMSFVLVAALGGNLEQLGCTVSSGEYAFGCFTAHSARSSDDEALKLFTANPDRKVYLNF